MKRLFHTSLILALLFSGTMVRAQFIDTTFILERNLQTQDIDTHEIRITQFDSLCRIASETYLDFTCRFGTHSGWCFRLTNEYSYNAQDSILEEIRFVYSNPTDPGSKDTSQISRYTRDSQGRVTQYQEFAFSGGNKIESKRTDYQYTGANLTEVVRFFHYQGKLNKAEETDYVFQNGRVSSHDFRMYDYLGDTLIHWQYTYHRSTGGRLDSIQSVKYDTVSRQFVPKGLEGWTYLPDSSHFIRYTIERDTTVFPSDTIQVDESKYSQGNLVYQKKRYRRGFFQWDQSEENRHYTNGLVDSVLILNSYVNLGQIYQGRSFREYTYKNGEPESERAMYHFRGQLTYDRTTYFPICEDVTISEIIEETSPFESLQVYPNPCSSYLMVPVKNTTNFTIRNLNGQEVLSGTLNPESHRIDLEDLPVGMFLLQLDEGKQWIRFVHSEG